MVTLRFEGGDQHHHVGAPMRERFVCAVQACTGDDFVVLVRQEPCDGTRGGRIVTDNQDTHRSLYDHHAPIPYRPYQNLTSANSAPAFVWRKSAYGERNPANTRESTRRA